MCGCEISPIELAAVAFAATVFYFGWIAFMIYRGGKLAERGNLMGGDHAG
jgi:hypothetical protein